MSDFDYKEGDEFDVTPKEGSKIALKILAAGGTYTLSGNIIKITSLPESDKKAKKVEAVKKIEDPKKEEPKAEEPKKVEEKEEPKAKPAVAKAEKIEDKE